MAWSELVDREELFGDLDNLRESGATNMFGATSYILSWFPELSKRQAKAALVEWMQTFGERHAA